MKKLVLILLAAAVFAPDAGAVTLVNPDGSVAQPYQSWAASMAIPGPNATVRIHVGVDACPGMGGCFVQNGTYVADVYLVENPSPSWRAGVLYHELGHAFDAYQLTWGERHRLKVALGFTRSTPWNQPSKPGPSEFFADAYRALALHGGCGGWMEGAGALGGYGYVPDCQSLRTVRRIVRQAA